MMVVYKGREEWKLSKTGFMQFLEAPLHLWADVHGLIQQEPSSYQRHLMEQGRQVGLLGQEFLRLFIAENYPGAELSFEARFGDEKFEARIDGLAFDRTGGVYDLFEVKSSTSVKKEHIYDAAFQRLIAESNIAVRSIFLVVMNGDYVREGNVDAGQLFRVWNVDGDVAELREEVLQKRELAWEAAQMDEPDGVKGCEQPKVCPCLELCHGALPENSIYDLPRLSVAKKNELKTMGVLRMGDIPADFPISEKQALHVKAAREGKAIMDVRGIHQALDGLEYPLYFLDYETYNPAVPMIDDYGPYEHIVFQYSLHVLRHPSGVVEHFDHLETKAEDPSRVVARRLGEDIGAHGSIVVWNQSFEATRNKEMARRYPESAEFLLGLNERMFDLMKIFSDGLYVDADFHGSASIKAVLPVLVGEGGYEELLIGKGDEAMVAWVELMRGMVVEDQVEKVRAELRRYCGLDTMAMVRNLAALKEKVGG